MIYTRDELEGGRYLGAVIDNPPPRTTSVAALLVYLHRVAVAASGIKGDAPPPVKVMPAPTKALPAPGWLPYKDPPDHDDPAPATAPEEDPYASIEPPF